jgi:DNA invertase Pin-like site-specific DNA recombinase
MPEAVIYARFSPRPNPEECDSVEKQLERCKGYCDAHGYTVVAERDDKDQSGGRADNRKGLQEALDFACKRKAVLVVYALSRLARNTRDALDIMERLNAAGADLAVIQESMNTRSPMGRFLFTFFSGLATLEREQIQERTALAMRHYQATGRRMSRLDRCPYGWQPDPEGPQIEGNDKALRPARLIPHPDEQAVIARIRKLCDEGLGLRQIARALDQAGLTCRGRRWHHSTIKAILGRGRQVAEAS